MPTSKPSEYTLVIITSGRWLYLALALASVKLLLFPKPQSILVVDSSQREMPAVIRRQLGGLGCSIRTVSLQGATLAEVLRHLWFKADLNGVVLHLEEDFVLCRRLRTAAPIAALLESGAAQVLLQRQRWYRREFAFASHEPSILSRHGGDSSEFGLLVPAFFSLNPCFYQADSVRRLCPHPDHSFGPLPELELGTAVGASAGSSLLWRTTRYPSVLHIGVLATAQYLEISRISVLRRSAVLLRSHAARIFHASVLSLRELLQRRCLPN